MGRGTRGLGRVGTWGRGDGDMGMCKRRLTVFCVECVKYNFRYYFLIASLGNIKIRNGTLKYIT